MSAAGPAGKREKKLKVSTTKASRVVADPHSYDHRCKWTGHAEAGCSSRQEELELTVMGEKLEN